MWQDTVLALTQIIFAVALLPTIAHATKKPTLSTALMTTSTVFVVVFVYISLALWSSAFGAGILGVEWATLAHQRYRLDHKK